MSKENVPSKQSESRQALKARLDRCLGCHWGDSEEVRPATVSKLMMCARAPQAASRLRALRDSGIAQSVLDKSGTTPQLLYTPTDTPEAQAYVDALPKGPCMSNLGQAPETKTYDLPPTSVPGATTAEAMAEANAAAEAFLLERSELSGPDAYRRYSLGCFSCHIFRKGGDGAVTIQEMANCTSRSKGAVHKLLQVMQGADLLTLDNPDAPVSRQSFRLAENENGQTMAGLLTPPTTCDYETGKLCKDPANAEATFQPLAGTVPLPELPA